MNYDLVLFDMGGVLVELGSLAETLGLDPAADPDGGADELWARWLGSETVRAFERGELSPETFGERLVVELGLDLTGPELNRRFEAFPRGIFAGAAELVTEVEAVCAVGILSNTNALHWDHQPDAAIISALGHPEHHYLSYRIGLVKPDAELFNHVVGAAGVAADRILFLDDNRINVDGARRAGMEAEVAKGVDDARRALIERGVLGR